MWWAGSDRVDVYLGLAEAGVACGDRAPHWRTHADLASGASAAFEHAASLCRSRWRRRPRVRVWLSGALARPFLCAPVAGLRRWTEVESLARAAAPDATGLAGPCTVRIESWPAPHAALAVGMDDPTVALIECAAANSRMRIASLRPWWGAALNRMLMERQAPRLVAIAEGDSLTLLGGTEGRFDVANAYVPRLSEEQAGQVVARIGMTAGIEAGRVWHAAQTRVETPGSNGVPFGMNARVTA